MTRHQFEMIQHFLHFSDNANYMRRDNQALSFCKKKNQPLLDLSAIPTVLYNLLTINCASVNLWFGSKVSATFENTCLTNQEKGDLKCSPCAIL